MGLHYILQGIQMEKAIWNFNNVSQYYFSAVVTPDE